MGRRMTPAKQEQLTPSCSQPQTPATVLIPPPAAAGRRGIIVTPLHFPSWHPPHSSQMFYSWKRVSSSFLCKGTVWVYFMLTHKAVGALDPSTVPTPWLTWGWGWRSDWSSSLSHSLPWFSHKENTYALLQRGTDSVTSHSFFQPQDSIRLLLESSGQSFSVTGGFWSALETKWKCLWVFGGHQTISDCLSEVIQLY